MGYEETAEKANLLLTRFLERNDITARSKEAINSHIMFMQAKGSSPRTLIKHVYCLGKFFDGLGKIDAQDATKQDIERAVAKIEGTGLAPDSKHHIKAIIKSFYKHMLGEDYFYPKQVAWIKTSSPITKHTLPEDIMDEEDILKMLKTTSNVRDQALIALLFDSGIRIGELLNMQLKDIDLRSEPAHIKVTGKTGSRKIPIMFSAKYLARYISSIKNRKYNDPLWLATGTWKNYNKPVEYASIRKALAVAAQRAGIEKRANPHSFRHARATHYANKLSDQQLKAFFGWGNDSKMASVYVHLSGRDLDKGVLEANGVKVESFVAEPKLTAKNCKRCEESNPTDSQYCYRCGSPMDEKVIVELGNKEKDMKEAIAETLKDPKAIEEIVHAYLMMKAKKAKKQDDKKGI